MYTHESDKPIPLDVIIIELSRIQDMALCANTSDEIRYVLSNIIEAGFDLISHKIPGFVGRGYHRKWNSIN